jgi:DNA topoisomerase-2
MSTESEWYCPVIPTVLINGAHSVRTGCSTEIPSYNSLTLNNNMEYYIQEEHEQQCH